MNCPLKHLHTIVPQEVRGLYYKTREWKVKMEREHGQPIKCKGCNKYLIWVKKNEH